MIVLDTNILSELLRPAPDPNVIEWLRSQPGPSVFTTVVTRGEILYGIEVLPEGQRRQKLTTAALDIFNLDFVGRVLDFDSDAADLYARIGAARRRSGRPMAQFDAVIAAIALSRGAVLATRNTKDFHGCGLEVVNPWLT